MLAMHASTAFSSSRELPPLSEEHLQPLYRHLDMIMKSRTLFFIAIGILILGIALFAFSTRNQTPAHLLPAAVNRDCAPWDGSAFTVQIPWQHGDVIAISIWKAPDIKVPVTFSFPDNTGQVGNASYQLASGDYEQLSGTIFFWRVAEGRPVEGRFELVTEAGQRFEGQFKADWGDQMMMCG